MQIAALSNELPQRPAGMENATFPAAGARCAVRSPSALPPRVRRACGSRSSRPAPSPRSRRSSLTGSSSHSVSRPKPASYAIATKPDCPFPARLDLVAGLDQGKVSLGVPIDMPFTELNRAYWSFAAQGQDLPRDRRRAGPGHGAVVEDRRVGRAPADLAPRQGEGEQELVRPRRGSDRPHLGQARARPRTADHPADRYRGRRAVGSSVRLARHRRPRGHPLSAGRRWPTTP